MNLIGWLSANSVWRQMHIFISLADAYHYNLIFFYSADGNFINDDPIIVSFLMVVWPQL